MFNLPPAPPSGITFRKGIALRLKQLRSYIQRTYFPRKGQFAGEHYPSPSAKMVGSE